MSEGDVIRLLIACGIAAVVGANGQSRFGGAHLFTIFAAIATFAAWSQDVRFSWLEVLAPVAFSYAAAAIADSMAKSRKRG